MRPVGCRSDDLLGGPIRVSRSRLKFKVSPLARTPGIRETGPGWDREGPPWGRCDGSGYARVSNHEQNHRPPRGCGCGRGSRTHRPDQQVPRPSGGCRGHALSGGRGAVGPVPCAGGSHDPSHHPQEGRPHDPRKRYDAIVLGSGQVSYLLLIGCLICLTCLGGLGLPPNCGGFGGWGGLGGTGGCGLGGGCSG